MEKKRFCLVGASSRGFGMYAARIASEKYRDKCKLVGIYDINPGRSRYVSQSSGDVRVYETFYEMIHDAKPDAVIVTTMDSFHAEYAIKAMEYGCDAIIEKPMCINVEQVRALLDARERTGKNITVTFNMRYMPYKLKVKQLLMSGVIGDIENVTFEWNLIYGSHGTSYFRRWHAMLENSGGLLLTKAAHHFDIANWYVNSYPAKVSAFGKLDRYGENGTAREVIGGDNPGTHCHCCPHKDTCKLASPTGEKDPMYMANRHYDGYTPDACLFRKEINIYDSACVNVLYENGVTMSYSLNANAPYEGWRIAFNGTKGRLEAGEILNGTADMVTFSKDAVRVIRYGESPEIVPVESYADVHGGGDERLFDDLIEMPQDDPYCKRASVVDGAASVLIGALANESIATGKILDVTERLGRELRSYRK